MRVVLDPAVLVAGIVDPQAPEGQLLDLAVSGEITLLVNDRVLDAYRTALTRPELQLPAGPLHQLVDFFAETGVAVPAGVDPGPAHMLGALADDGCADALVLEGAAGSARRAVSCRPTYTSAGVLAALRVARSPSLRSPSR